MADLATELSYGAVAGLSLAPDDPRFAALLREALGGGASRFAAVVDANQPIRYVIPVRVQDESDALGSLVVQQDQLALVWRSPNGLSGSVRSQLDQYTRIFESWGEVKGEPWVRFRVKDAAKTWTFLVPPALGGLLVPTLRSNLLTWLRPEPTKTPRPPIVRTPAPNSPQPEPTELLSAVPPAAEEPTDSTLILPAVGPTEEEPSRWVHKSSPVAVPSEAHVATETAPPTQQADGAEVARFPVLARSAPGVHPRSTTLLGFLIGLAASLAIGGVWLISQLAG